eukprot:351357-Chlamydomonas_euryale.AAC.7
MGGHVQKRASTVGYRTATVALRYRHPHARPLGAITSNASGPCATRAGCTVAAAPSFHAWLLRGVSSTRSLPAHALQCVYHQAAA